MRLFPKRDPEDGKITLIGLYIFGGTCAISTLLFVYGGTGFPPPTEGIWGSIRWIAALVALFSAYLTLQVVFELFVHFTIGMERFIALIIVLGIGVVGYNLLVG
ncbi:hypothetical protein [uncultured Tateyamaria sp.]|uniref:hypothetical protein n=1 Tax=Tateyamaria sp. 1078 TaxID=3417464 RepID=UPI0026392B3A|nr:hypothetical protein [uncultured Tateyamaria sp.]